MHVHCTITYIRTLYLPIPTLILPLEVVVSLASSYLSYKSYTRSIPTRLVVFDSELNHGSTLESMLFA